MALGVFLLLTALVMVFAIGFRPMFRALGLELNANEGLGLGALVGLSLWGLTCFVAGWVLHGLNLAWVFPLIAIGLAVRNWKESSRDIAPNPNLKLVFVGCIALLLLPFLGVFSPSTPVEWDSLAYHLAVPKIWAATGHISSIQGIHHSNFPFAVEVITALFPVEAMEVAAKSISFLHGIACAVAVFGFAQRILARHDLDPKLASWAPIALLASPVFVWELGTAYIDSAHGAFAGLAVLYAADWVYLAANKQGSARQGILIGLLLGGAIGSKFTGLQTMGLVLAGLAVAGIATKSIKRTFTVAIAACVVALLVGGGWYVKTYAEKGNPVYPFFFEKLGGKDWDQWRADLYRDEQQSFGVGRTEKGRDPQTLGHAILGLAYQPGRYTNPNQTNGGGFPIGAIGGLTIFALFGLAILGFRRPEERFAVGVTMVHLLAWFFLSQQSRYMASLSVVAAGVFPLLLARQKFQKVGFAFAALQGLFTIYALKSMVSPEQLKVPLGVTSPDDFRKAAIPFQAAASEINRQPSVTKVALYDEVFGFLLNKPYFWANPGHSMLIPYDKMKNGDDYVKVMSDLKFSHVFVNLAMQPRERSKKFISEAGLEPGEGFSSEEKKQAEADQNLKWAILIAQAAKKGKLKMVFAERGSVLFEIVPNK